MKTSRLVSVSVASLLAAGVACGQQTSSGPSAFALSLDAGTSGLGASLWITASERFTLTLGYGALDVDEDYTTDEVDYAGTAEIANGHALLNWHPFAGRFHLSGGAMLADNRFDAVATPASGTTYEFNGTTYTAAQVGTLSAQADVGDGIVPYLGLGWSKSPRGGGFGLFLSLGVMFSGSIEPTLTATGPIASDPTFQQNLEQERQELQDELDKYKIFPVARVGVMYRF